MFVSVDFGYDNYCWKIALSEDPHWRLRKFADRKSDFVHFRTVWHLLHLAVAMTSDHQWSKRKHPPSQSMLDQPCHPIERWSICQIFTSPELRITLKMITTRSSLDWLGGCFLLHHWWSLVMTTARCSKCQTVWKRTKYDFLSTKFTTAIVTAKINSNEYFVQNQH